LADPAHIDLLFVAVEVCFRGGPRRTHLGAWGSRAR